MRVYLFNRKGVESNRRFAGEEGFRRKSPFLLSFFDFRFLIDRGSGLPFAVTILVELYEAE